MSFASGFFNSVDHDRLYDATDISRLFDGLIRDGIFASIGDCLVVKQSNQMNVTVGTGRAWFNHTWSYNDALYPVTIPPSEILMDRIDAIVLEINSFESVRANSIKLIKGTPASTPTKPALTNTKEIHQYPLAYVKVGKEVTSIRQADIENCVGTSACPFVTGILEVISIEQLIPQWRDILNRFVEENTANFNTWMNGEKQDYQAWLTAAKKEITDWQATSKSDYQKWYDSIKNGYAQWFATIKAAYDANWSTFQQWEKTSQTEFDTWFENMKNKLEGDLGVSYGVNAPANPKAGDLWIDPSSGSLIQYWTGSKWTPTRALDIYGSDVVKSNIKPSSKRSTLWIDSGNGNAMKHVAEDGTVTELSSGGYHYGSSAPSNTKLLWIDTSGVARFYNGSAWTTLKSPGGK